MNPGLVGVAVNEAHGLGLRCGHMRITSWVEAARAGIDSLEHSGADGPSWERVSNERLKNLLRGQNPPGAHRLGNELDPSAISRRLKGLPEPKGTSSFNVGKTHQWVPLKGPARRASVSFQLARLTAVVPEICFGRDASTTCARSPPIGRRTGRLPAAGACFWLAVAADVDPSTRCDQTICNLASVLRWWRSGLERRAGRGLRYERT